MKIRASCPSGCQLKIPDKFLGEVVACPKCNASFTVEAAPQASVAVDIGEPFRDVQSVGFEIESPINSAREFDDTIQIDTTVVGRSELPDAGQLRLQVDRSRNDRILVSRFIAILILVVGLVNIVPAIYHWYLWSTNPLQTMLPKWIFLVVFVAALHLLYSIFVFQICDWSALSAIAVVTLIFAGVFGFVFAELVLAKEQANVANSLELPSDMVRTAIIWSAAMLLLELVTCYLTARESFHWQRIDRLSYGLATKS